MYYKESDYPFVPDEEMLTWYKDRYDSHNDAPIYVYLITLYLMGKITAADIDITLGHYYGFPDCCINHFVSCSRLGIKYVAKFSNTVYGKQKEGIGYVQCPACRKANGNLQNRRY